LTGGSGSDRFVLGETFVTYYNDGDPDSAGTGDYALIADFNNGDVIQLPGFSGDYKFEGGSIFLTQNQVVPELIAVVQGPGALNLDPEVGPIHGFDFV